jgi:hypothetical protein
MFMKKAMNWLLKAVSKDASRTDICDHVAVYEGGVLAATDGARLHVLNVTGRLDSWRGSEAGPIFLLSAKAIKLQLPVILAKTQVPLEVIEGLIATCRAESMDWPNVRKAIPEYEVNIGVSKIRIYPKYLAEATDLGNPKYAPILFFGSRENDPIIVKFSWDFEYLAVIMPMSL